MHPFLESTGLSNINYNGMKIIGKVIGSTPLTRFSPLTGLIQCIDIVMKGRYCEMIFENMEPT